MKVRENITIYQCDYCSKKLFRAKTMEKHEIKCAQNPLNIRACFDCANCEQVDIVYEPKIQTFENDELRKSTTFKCNVKNTFMFHPKLEHSENGVPDYVLYKGEEISQDAMPMKCEIKDEQQKRMSDLLPCFGSCT